MTKQEIKVLCDEMPYLIPRNAFSGEISKDYDYSYIHGDGSELPEGWQKLFLQMCRDIKQPLIDANYLDKFYFIQVKEKYGEMRVYTSACPDEVDRIISKYTYVSRFVCSMCGKPAVFMTDGYILPYCDDCWKNFKSSAKGNFIEFNPIMTVHGFSRARGKYTDCFDCFDIWRRLYNE